jgi:hypothetical protein
LGEVPTWHALHTGTAHVLCGDAYQRAPDLLAIDDPDALREAIIGTIHVRRTDLSGGHRPSSRRRRNYPLWIDEQRPVGMCAATRPATVSQGRLDAQQALQPHVHVPPAFVPEGSCRACQLPMIRQTRWLLV